MGFTVIMRKNSNSAGLTHHLKRKLALAIVRPPGFTLLGYSVYLRLLYLLIYILIYVLGYDTLIS